MRGRSGSGYKLFGKSFFLCSLFPNVQRSERQVSLSIANGKFGYFILSLELLAFGDVFIKCVSIFTDTYCTGKDA
jgi:hypothetical protein